jgi:hypothetical protein
MEFTQSARHTNWSAKRKTRARVRAEKLGALERRVVSGKWFPHAVLMLSIGAVGVLGGLIESIKL